MYVIVYKINLFCKFFYVNKGTSITNTLVTFSQIGNRNEFARSFSSGVLMDVFNYLTTFILLPMEIFIDQITINSDTFHRKCFLFLSFIIN